MKSCFLLKYVNVCVGIFNAYVINNAVVSSVDHNKLFLVIFHLNEASHNIHSLVCL